MPKNKISLLSAVLICINVVVGAGLFINPQHLAVFAGPYGFFGYILAAVILLPLILSIAELTRFQPVSGGLYVYSKEYLGLPMGFLSGWSYFIAKSVSAIFILNIFVAYIQARIPQISDVPIVYLDYIIVASVIALNSIGVSIGGRVQYFFVFLKFLPLLFAFICGFWAFEPGFFFPVAAFPGSFFQAIPLCLFALVGFEVICSVGSLVENPTVNIRKAIIYSFTTIVVICLLFSLASYGALGMLLTHSNETLFLLGQKVLPQYPFIARLMNGLVFSSLVIGAFSILTSNCWNLHTLAKYDHFPLRNILTRVNRFDVPWVSLIIEGIMACIMITITTGAVQLRNMSVFVLFICYFLTALAAYRALGREKGSSLARWVPLVAAVGCGYVVVTCLKNIIDSGLSVSFLVVFILGCVLSFGWTIYKRSKNTDL